jgi:transcriptional regulator with XRE-family HTH domain
MTKIPTSATPLGTSSTVSIASMTPEPLRVTPRLTDSTPEGTFSTLPMPKTTPLVTFGSAFGRARRALGIQRDTVAGACGVRPRTVSRWENDQNSPSLADRHRLLHVVLDAPLEQLEELARLAGTTLDAAGIEVLPPDEPTVVALPAAAPAPQALPGPTAQKAIDDAIREAAEELNVRAGDLRAAAGKLLAAIRGTGATLEEATRMVLARPPPPAR